MSAVAGDYQFSAEPRAVQARSSKYRQVIFEPPPPANIMFDRRIVRGNTYAAMIIPSSTQQEMERMQDLEQNRQKRLLERQRQLREESEMQSKPQPFQVGAYEEAKPEGYEEIRDRPAAIVTQAFTDFYVDRQPEAEFKPDPKGLDKNTQIEGDELFDYDLEVEPILQVIVGKTLEQARMEVSEEDELAEAEQNRLTFERERNYELIDVQRLEAEAIRKEKERKRRDLQAKTRREQKKFAHQKYVARILAKRFVHRIPHTSFVALRDQGVLAEPSEANIHRVLVPWMMENAYLTVIDDLSVQQSTEGALDRAREYLSAVRRASINAELKRREDVKAEKLRIAQETADRKERRREQRAIRKAEQELQALRDRVEAEIIARGSYREGITVHQVSDIDGRQNTQIVGTPGGQFLEFVLVLRALEELMGITLSAENVYEVLTKYLLGYMKAPNFTFANVDQEAFEHFCESLEEDHEIKVTRDNLNTLEPEIAAKVLAFFKNVHNGVKRSSLSIVWAYPEAYFLRSQLIELVIEAWWRVLSIKKPEEVGDEPPPRNPLEGKSRLVLMNLPEEGSEVAVCRIRIPFKPEEIKENDSAEDEELHTVREEVVIENRTLLVTPQSDSLSVFVVHQAAQRLLRREICEAVHVVKQFESVRIEALVEAVAEKGELLEKRLLRELAEELPVFDFEIN
mmetsp:Transcript_26549/g.47682  ORF Transcript_26549/g.47682 Transcript_26549/m.47682 type:complete len:685 (-) Transcript_26549:292-2346(-)